MPERQRAVDKATTTDCAHGTDGLREFSTPKSIARQTRKAALNLLSMQRSEKDMHLVAKPIPMLHGRSSR